MSFKFEFKNLPSRAPPPVDVPFNPKNSYKTALANLCIANGMKMEMKTSMTSDKYIHTWTAVCSIDGEETGKGAALVKKSAEREAARVAIDALPEKDFLSSGRRYFPIFMDYVTEHHLDQRIVFKAESNGPDHERNWKSTVYLDGIEIGQGSGATKKSAMEEASVSTASTWPWSFGVRYD